MDSTNEDLHDDLLDWAMIGASQMARGLTDFESWSRAMLAEEHSESIRSLLPVIFDHSKKILERTENIFDAAEERRHKLATGDENPPKPTAGLNFPWENISGFCLRFVSMMGFAALEGDRVGTPMLGAYGLAEMELPNPDISAQQRLITVPIKTKGDYKSICRAQLDSGVRDGSIELVVVYEHRRGFFGGAKPGLHIAAYPAGTWEKFFDAVSHYKSQDFVWPSALFLYQPTNKRLFPARNNLFSE